MGGLAPHPEFATYRFVAGQAGRFFFLRGVVG